MFNSLIAYFICPRQRGNSDGDVEDSGEWFLVERGGGKGV